MSQAVITQADADRYLTAPQVSERIGLHAQTVRLLIDSGPLPAVRIGLERFVHENDLTPFLPPPGWATMLTVPQAADALGISKRYAYHLARAGDLPVVRHPAASRGSAGMRIRREDLKKWKRRR